MKMDSMKIKREFKYTGNEHQYNFNADIEEHLEQIGAQFKKRDESESVEIVGHNDWED